MPTTAKVLGQTTPAAATTADLYVVPAATFAVCSTVVVCNRGTGAAKFRIAVRPAGVALAAVHYLYHDASIAANSTVTITIGLTLAATDVVSVLADVANVNFHLYGTVTT